MFRRFGMVFWIALIALDIYLVIVRPARADVPGGASFSFPIYTLQSGSTWFTSYYTPDSNNALCPPGQYYATIYQGSAAWAPVTVSTQFTGCTSNSMYVNWWGNLHDGLTELPAPFTCPDGTVFDQSSGNCLGSLTSIDDTVNGWGWGFGVIAISTILGWLLGHVMGVFDALAED